MITTGQAHRLALTFSQEGEGMARFAETGTVTMLARSELVRLEKGDTGEWPDPQGTRADARALADWMDAHVGYNDWGNEWDDTVVPWSYGR